MPGNLNHRFEKNIVLPEAAIPAYARKIESFSLSVNLGFIIFVAGFIAMSNQSLKPYISLMMGIIIVAFLIEYALISVTIILALRIRWADRVRVGLMCRRRIAQMICLAPNYRPPFVGIEGLTRHQMDEFMVKVRKLNRSSMQTGRLSELENAYAEFTKSHAG